MSAIKTDASPNGPGMRSLTEISRMFASCSFLARLANSFFALLGSIKFQRRERVMSLSETLPLGEKRFLAIVKVEEQRFLIAATSQSVAVLHRLDSSQGQQSRDQDVAQKGGKS